FLMIFFAVTMGFFAENVREHIADNDKGKQYIQSLYNDMQQDSINLKTVIVYNERQIKMFDTLMTLIHQPSLDSEDINKVYFFARFATRTSIFEPTDRTILQLNNSGNFRLIKNISLADSILQYERDEANYKQSISISSTERYALYPFISTIFDATVFTTMVDSANHIHPPVGLHSINISDKKLINQFIYYLHQVQSTRVAETRSLQRLSKQSTEIRNLIKQNYTLQ
ncbi:MAG TPA: hypothetical protein VGI61_07225, partial [Parafilimonas sp.]